MKKLLFSLGLISFAAVHADEHSFPVITDATFQEKTSKGKVVVKFFREGCGFCQAAEKTLKMISPSYPDVTILEMDAEAPASQKMANKEGIQGLPVFVFYKDGKRISKSHSGITSPEQIKSAFSAAGF